MNQKIQDKINNLNQCSDCVDVKIKKFTPIVDFPDYSKLDKDFHKCSCGKRPLDVVMSHILKIMIEEDVVNQNATLRRNSPIPMPAFCYSNFNPQFIGSDDLILIHPDFNENVALRLFNEVPEVKGVLKGSGSDTVGILNRNSDNFEFELLAGESDRVDVLRTLIKDLIVISKNQKNSNIEVASTTEVKLLNLYNYLENENINKGIAIDGMCGSGAIGIFLLKYGFKKVIFNDINPQAIENLKVNLKLNNIEDDLYEIYNESIEDLTVPNVDLAIIDAFPGVDISEIEEKLAGVSKNIFII